MTEVSTERLCSHGIPVDSPSACPGCHSGHTPGPWRYQLNHASSSWYVIAEGKPWFVCEMSWNEMEQDNFRNRIGSEANARLIAAAPDLLEALKNMVGFCATGCAEAEMAMDDGRKAIAKAEDRSADPIGDKLRSLPVIGTLYIDDPHDPRNEELKL